MSKVHDLTGQHFFMLTVLERAGSNKRRRATWLCQCECGNEKIIDGDSLIQGKTKSCGCYQPQAVRKYNVENKTTHGKRYTRIYKEWASMKNRCYGKRDYKNYRSRGIVVCDEWKNDFMAFYSWAMSHGYADNLTLDRKDVNGNYCPENCRWATPKEQANNKRNSHYLTHDGETHTIAEWAEIKGINYQTLYSRLTTKGWPVEKELTTPTH